MEYTIRKVRDKDRHDVVDVFNYFIETGYAAYPEKKVGYDFFERLKEIAVKGLFYTVATSEKKAVGFGLLKRYQVADTFKKTAEVAYFILPAHADKGLGTMLLDRLTEDAKKAGIDTLLASISSLNRVSIGFHRKRGFRECGRFRRVGRKNGRDFDVIWMQRFI